MDSSEVESEFDQKDTIGIASNLRTQIINGVYTLTKITGRNSKVFEVFCKIIDDKGQEITNFVACKHCFNAFKFHKSSSNLVKHKCYKKRKLELTEQTTSVYANIDAATKQSLEDAVLQWNIESLRSLGVFEDSGLQKLMSFFIALGAKYGENVDINDLLPRAADVSKRVRELYRDAIDELRQDIDSIRYVGYGLTTDVWSIKNICESFLFVTIHYIKNGELFNRFLGMGTMDKNDYTGTDIKEAVREILTDFDLTLDNGYIILTNNDEKMVQAFLAHNRIYCINHLLDSTLEEALNITPEIAEICDTAGPLYSFLSQVETIQDEAAEVLSTRWNRTYNMLSFLTKYWDKIIQTSTDKEEISKLIQVLNLNHITALVDVLKPFQESYKDLNNENCVTLHLVIVHVHRLRKLCVKSQYDLDIIKKFKFNLLKSFDTFVLKNMTLQHKLALYLFPPANKLISFSQVDKDLVRSECKNLMKGFIDENENGDKRDVAHSTIQIDDKDAMMEFLENLEELPSTSTSSKSNINSELFSDFIHPTESLSCADERVINEMRLYEDTVVALQGDFDILKWWHLHRTLYPLLYKVSCKLLAVPASSVTVENVILKARPLIYDNQGPNSGEDIVNETLFLHFNIDKKEASCDVTMEKTI